MKTFFVALIACTGMLCCSPKTPPKGGSPVQPSPSPPQSDGQSGKTTPQAQPTSGGQKSFLCHCLNPDNTETTFILEGKGLPDVQAKATERCQKLSKSFKKCSPTK